MQTGQSFLRRAAKRAFTTEPLTRLANRYGSDKGNAHGAAHEYTFDYARHFGPLRRKPIKLLEIGLCVPRAHDGSQPDVPSLRVWIDYFPNAAVYGMDITDFSMIRMERARIFQADQSSEEDLNRVATEAGGDFDVIIDDGSHASAHQQITLANLYPHLKGGGLFAIEDLNWPPSQLERQDVPKTVDLLRGLQRGDDVHSPCWSEEQTKYIVANTEQVWLYDSRQGLEEGLTGGLGILKKNQREQPLDF